MMGCENEPKKDGTDQLCEALYNRKATAKDWVGGSESKMLYDAAATIRDMTTRLIELEEIRRDDETGRWYWITSGDDVGEDA